ncbi:hypothetical protein pb186bvf_000991 [Paramecium bursaria]
MIKNVSLQTESDKDSPIEIMRGNLSPGTGPFQYGPLQRLEHPIQPDDDVSIKDPTIKTVDRSRLSHSPHHMLQISGKSLEQDLIPDANKESYLDSPKIAFSQKSLETTIKEAQTRLLSPKFLQRWRVKSTIDQRVNLYLHKDIKEHECSQRQQYCQGKLTYINTKFNIYGNIFSNNINILDRLLFYWYYLYWLQFIPYSNTNEYIIFDKWPNHKRPIYYFKKLFIIQLLY